MKVSENFKAIIANYLQQKATTDVAFAPALEKTSKSLDNCIHYILTEVKKTGLCAFADNEIFDMAVQYYNDDTIIPTENKHNVNIQHTATPDLFTTPIVATPTTTEKRTVLPTPQSNQTSLTLFD